MTTTEYDMTPTTPRKVLSLLCLQLLFGGYFAQIAWLFYAFAGIVVYNRFILIFLRHLDTWKAVDYTFSVFLIMSCMPIIIRFVHGLGTIHVLRRGVPGEARVVSIHDTGMGIGHGGIDTLSGSDRPDPIYRITFNMALPNGQRLVFTVTTSRMAPMPSGWIGGLYPVYYLPTNPKIVRFLDIEDVIPKISISDEQVIGGTPWMGIAMCIIPMLVMLGHIAMVCLHLATTFHLWHPSLP